MATGFPIIFGSGQLWTPARISTASWWDAADSSSITLSSGKVSQWNDKSGNGKHMTQATAASQPTYGITSFSLPSVNFLDNFMASTAFAGAASDWAIYGINKQTEVSPVNNDSIISTNSGTTGTFQISTTGTTIIASCSQDGTGTFFGITMDSVSTPVYRLLGLETSTSPGTVTYLNGTSTGTNAFTCRNTATNGFRLNINRAGGNFLQSDHAEWVVLSSVPSTAVRQQIEGYLAWKWGQVSLLPATHPYKNSPPR
jgi:hypothetical protein